MAKETRQSYAAKVKAMHQRILQDLAARGLSDEDIEGMEQDTRVDGGQVQGWEFRVALTGGRSPLVYRLENREGAELRCNGSPLQQIGEA
jgi:hypothetical protein